MEHWAFWEWIAYCTLWVAAIIIAIDGGLRMTPLVSENLPRRLQFLKSVPWAFAPLVLILVSTASFLLHEFWPSSEGRASAAKIQLLTMAVRDTEDPVKFNYYFQNSETVPAIGFITNGSMAIADKEKTSDELDQAFLLLKTSWRPLENQKMDSEIQPKEVRFITLPYSITQEQYKSVTQGDKFLYLLVIAEYRDTSTPRGKWRITEICHFTFKGQAYHTCPTHNRIYTSE